MREVRVIEPFSAAAAGARDDDLIRYEDGGPRDRTADSPFVGDAFPGAVDRRGTDGYVDTEALGVVHPGATR
jgi:hypothetical protein